MVTLGILLSWGKPVNPAIVMVDHVTAKPDNVSPVKETLKVLFQLNVWNLYKNRFVSSGFKCEKCKPGYFGNPTTSNCQPCLCDHLGSLSKECDKLTGQCLCKERFTGLTCDKCEVKSDQSFHPTQLLKFFFSRRAMVMWLPFVPLASAIWSARSRKCAILTLECVIVVLEWKDFIVMPASICIMGFRRSDVKVSTCMRILSAV